MLAGELVKDAGHHLLDVALLMAQVVVERLDRRVDDLQLGRRQVQVEGDLARPDQVLILAGHPGSFLVGGHRTPLSPEAVAATERSASAWPACRPPGLAWVSCPSWGGSESSA